MYLNDLHPKKFSRVPTYSFLVSHFELWSACNFLSYFFYFKSNRRPYIPQEMRKIPLSTLLIPDLRNGRRKKNHTTARSRTRKRRKRPPFTVPFAPLFLKSPPILIVGGGGGGGGRKRRGRRRGDHYYCRWLEEEEEEEEAAVLLC